jgi:hypothetical protein
VVAYACITVRILMRIKADKKKSTPATYHGGAWGERKCSSYSFTTPALDEGEWSASRPGLALPPGKGPWYPLYSRLDGPQIRFGHRCQRKFFCPCRGSNLDRPVVQPVARHYTDWATRFTIKADSLVNPSNLWYLKLIDVWDIAPCSLVEVDRRFRATYSLHCLGDCRDDGIFNETTTCCIPEGCHLCTHHLLTWNVILWYFLLGILI